MGWAFALAVGVLAALPSLGPSLPHDAAKWLLNARPLLIRRLDADLDGDEDRIAVVQHRNGQTEAVTLCHHPARWWQPWERCGSLEVGGWGTEAGPAQVERLETGEVDGDGRVDLLVVLKTADDLHHLALGPLLKPHGFVVAPELHLRAQGFSVWDVADRNQAVVVALRPEGATNGPAYVTYVREATAWRRSHGVDLPPAGDGGWGMPVTRVPDLRGESLPTALAMLKKAGLRPGMVAAVDQGKGFRDVQAQRPAPGDWTSAGRPVDLAVTVSSYPARVVEAGELARVVVHGPGGKRVEVQPEELQGWREELGPVLATIQRRVRTGGPPLKGPAGVPLVPGETAVEIFFQPALRVELPDGVIEASSILLPFVEYERGLLFLGSPGYQEAVSYSHLNNGLARRAYLLTHGPPGGQE